GAFDGRAQRARGGTQGQERAEANEPLDLRHEHRAALHIVPVKQHHLDRALVVQREAPQEELNLVHAGTVSIVGVSASPEAGDATTPDRATEGRSPSGGGRVPGRLVPASRRRVRSAAGPPSRSGRRTRGPAATPPPAPRGWPPPHRSSARWRRRPAAG